MTEKKFDHVDPDHVRHEQEILGRLESREEFPNVVLIDTVSYCNLHCPMCVHPKMTRKKGKMPRELFKRIISEIAIENKGIRVWLVYFGEIFILRPDELRFYIQFAKESGLKDVVLNSNGNLMTEEKAKILIESELDAIYFGIDAATEETYRVNRSGGNYQTTVANILRLVKLKKQMGKFKPDVFVQFVEMENNYTERDDFVSFWTKRGVSVKLRPMCSWAGKIDAPNQKLTNADRWPCHWCMQALSITNTGHVTFCVCDLDMTQVVGDINIQTIKEVWQSGRSNLRQLHRDERWSELPDICKHCGDWQAARSEYTHPGKLPDMLSGVEKIL